MNLGHHGDAELAEGLIDLAVNVRQAPLPGWLAGPIHESMSTLDRYPDATLAREAVARRHGRTPEEVLLTAGAAQAFVLIAQALRGAHRPAVVHPQFTEPEAALLAAGHQVHRVLLPQPFALDTAAVPADSELVFIGNPTNPTSVLHPASAIAGLARPGRVLVVDEAFADTIPGEPESLAGRRDLPGLVVLRSLTKTWALAGLRIGYLLAPAELVRRFASVQPLWPVSTPALAAALACAQPQAVAAEHAIAEQLQEHRDHLVRGLTALPGISVCGQPASSFVLIQVRDGLAVRAELRERGYAVRRGDTFPGLGPDWLRIAVRPPAVIDPFLAAFGQLLATHPMR